MRRTTLFSSFALIGSAVFVVSAAGFEARPEIDTAAKDRLTADVKFLSADGMEGRGIGTDGLNKAADFIKSEFAKAGLAVDKVDGDAFQKFTMVTGTDLGEKNTLTFVGPDGKTIPVEFDTAFKTCAFGKSGRFNNEVAFAGYGIKTPAYDDFAEQDLKDKVLIILRRTPQQGKSDGPFAGRRGAQYGSLRSKLQNAVKAGAAAVLFVNDPHTIGSAGARAQARLKLAEGRLERAESELADAEGDAVAAARAKVELLTNRRDTAKKAAEKPDHDDLMEFGYGGNADDEMIPAFHLRNDAVDQLLQAAVGKSLKEFEKEIDAELKPITTSLEGWKADGIASIKRIDTEVKNVIGVLEAEGPLANETVVIGAHYDHVGMGAQGSMSGGPPEIHNGADDNASGTASLIELARQIQASGVKPKRRMVFIAFTAEERGLIGSKRYCEEPVFSLKDTVAMFNMDMVGRLSSNRLTIYGSGTATGWDKRIAELGLKYQFDLNMQPAGLGPSDHASFYRKEIPVLHFFTGVHPNYHRPSDDWDLVNFNGMARIVDSVEEIAMEVAQADKRPEYVELNARAQINETASRPYFGIIPDLTADTNGVRIGRVADGGPAATVGVKAGDVVTKLGGMSVSNLDDLNKAIRAQKAGVPVKVVLKRGEEDVELTVTLAEPR